MNQFCKILVALNQYKGILCDSKDDAEYTFEVISSGYTDQYNNGNYSLEAFHNGVQSDISFNGWKFSGLSRGHYHYPGTYSSVSVNIDCLDPKGNNLTKHVSNSKTDDYTREGAALYMNTIALICLFDDVREYEMISVVFDTYKNCIYDDKLKEILLKLIDFNKVIKRNEGNQDIPTHFVENAKLKYKRILNYIKDKVDLEKIFDFMFE